MSLPYYPLRLSYSPHAAVWGGERLASRYGKTGASPLAETWELSVREDGNMSMIENGSCAGMPLGDYLATAREESGEGKAERFPLLVKFIDAAKPLSVQVHPDDTYAAVHERDSGKTELWVILEAAPGARLTLGLADRAGGKEAFAAALEEGSPESFLREVEVRAGECYFIPAGLLHAIGAGITLAEIQQNSDLTYRVWDYNRLGLDGRPRPLHTAKALDVLRCYTPEEIAALRFARPCPLPGECLCAAAQFAVSRFCGAGTLSIGERFISLLCTGGTGTLTHAGIGYAISAGQSWFLPAHMGECHLAGNAELLLAQA